MAQIAGVIGVIVMVTIILLFDFQHKEQVGINHYGAMDFAMWAAQDGGWVGVLLPSS